MPSSIALRLSIDSIGKLQNRIFQIREAPSNKVRYRKVSCAWRSGNKTVPLVLVYLTTLTFPRYRVSLTRESAFRICHRVLLEILTFPFIRTVDF